MQNLFSRLIKSEILNLNIFFKFIIQLNNYFFYFFFQCLTIVLFLSFILYSTLIQILFNITLTKDEPEKA